MGQLQSDLTLLKMIHSLQLKSHIWPFWHTKDQNGMLANVNLSKLPIWRTGGNTGSFWHLNKYWMRLKVYQNTYLTLWCHICPYLLIWPFWLYFRFSQFAYLVVCTHPILMYHIVLCLPLFGYNQSYRIVSYRIVSYRIVSCRNSLGVVMMKRNLVLHK